MKVKLPKSVVVGKLSGMSEEYWLMSESIAREVMLKMGKSPSEIEAQMLKVRRELGYCQPKE